MHAFLFPLSLFRALIASRFRVTDITSFSTGCQPQLLLRATGYEPQPGQTFKRTQVYAKALPERRKGGSTTPFPMT
jgi:hypothetical protein